MSTPCGRHGRSLEQFARDTQKLQKELSLLRYARISSRAVVRTE